jgi:hypothetical protein
MKKAIAIALFGCLAIIGCTQVPLAPAHFDTAAKSFEPVSDKAVIYVFRNTSFGGAIIGDVTVNERHIGALMAYSYARIEVPSGKCHVYSKLAGSCTVTLDVENGEIYYIRQSPQMGFWAAGCTLDVVSEADGQDGVLDCKHIDTVR